VCDRTENAVLRNTSARGCWRQRKECKYIDMQGVWCGGFGIPAWNGEGVICFTLRIAAYDRRPRIDRTLTQCTLLFSRMEMLVLHSDL
jgi:hypothetical protein